MLRLLVKCRSRGGQATVADGGAAAGPVEVVTGTEIDPVPSMDCVGDNSGSKSLSVITSGNVFKLLLDTFNEDDVDLMG